jgi:hypothetical protein
MNSKIKEFLPPVDKNGKIIGSINVKDIKRKMNQSDDSLQSQSDDRSDDSSTSSKDDSSHHMMTHSTSDSDSLREKDDFPQNPEFQKVLNARDIQLKTLTAMNRAAQEAKIKDEIKIKNYLDQLMDKDLKILKLKNEKFKLNKKIENLKNKNEKIKLENEQSKEGIKALKGWIRRKSVENEELKKEIKNQKIEHSTEMARNSEILQKYLEDKNIQIKFIERGVEIEKKNSKKFEEKYLAAKIKAEKAEERIKQLIGQEVNQSEEPTMKKMKLLERCPIKYALSL